MGLLSLFRRGDSSADWRAYFKSELEKLRDLPEGHDSWSPHAPDKLVISTALEIANAVKRNDLPLPLLVAGSDGSLQIKWRATRELSFFVSLETVEFLKVDRHGEMTEGPIKSVHEISPLIDWLLAA